MEEERKGGREGERGPLAPFDLGCRYVHSKMTAQKKTSLNSRPLEGLQLARTSSW
jgi:hypothetical protein